MSSPLVSISSDALDTVTGGGSSVGSNLDGLLNQLNSITSTLKDINKKTSGLGSTEMLMLCLLASQSRGNSSFVYVRTRRGGCW